MPTKKAAARPSRPAEEEEYEEAPVADTNGDDEEDEAPPTMKIRRGISAARQVIDSTSSFAQAFKLTEQIQIIKFLEEDNYASYKRHWVERMTPTGRANRSYNCLSNWGKRCPLCEVGDKAQAVVAFNVALVGDDGVPVLKTFDCGPKLFGIVDAYTRDPKVAPLNKGYFLASRSGKQGTVNYQIVPIKPHSLVDDYDIDPPDAAQLKAIGLYDAEIITMPKTKDMEEIAAEIANEYA